MAQLFSGRATTAFRAALVGAVVVLAGSLAAGMTYVRTGSYWNVGQPASQPIPFRHDLHAGKLGLDCRFCHNTVERAADAGMPAAHTCLACHSQIWQGADILEPLRTSMALKAPIRWSSVHRLPTHAYFHHGAHISRGVTCETCHGEVQGMPKTVKVKTMSMGWCLDCHRNVPDVRGTSALAAANAETSHPATAQSLLMSCSTCHR